jgi:hypothetical protein
MAAIFGRRRYGKRYPIFHLDLDILVLEARILDAY